MFALAPSTAPQAANLRGAVRPLDAVVALSALTPEGDLPAFLRQALTQSQTSLGNAAAGRGTQTLVEARIVSTSPTGDSTVEIGGESLLVRLSSLHPDGVLVQLRLVPGGGRIAPGNTLPAAAPAGGPVSPGAMQAVALGATPHVALGAAPHVALGATPHVALGATARALAQAAMTDLLPAPLAALSGVSPAQPRALAQALETALRSSGVFYESHQARWVEGRFPESMLRAESEIRTASAALTQMLTATPEIDATAQTQMRWLAQGELRLSVELWAGHTAELVFRKEDSGNRQPPAGTAPDAASFSTRLRLTLPRLGPLDARLRLQGAQVWLTLAADDAGAAAALQSESAGLADAFWRNGLTLLQTGAVHAL